MGLSLRKDAGPAGGSLFKKTSEHSNYLCVQSPVGSRSHDIGVRDFTPTIAEFARAYQKIVKLVASETPVRVIPWLLDGEHPMVVRQLSTEPSASASTERAVPDVDDEDI